MIVEIVVTGLSLVAIGAGIGWYAAWRDMRDWRRCATVLMHERWQQQSVAINVQPIEQRSQWLN